jgi:hypothetical protein
MDSDPTTAIPHGDHERDSMFIVYNELAMRLVNERANKRN